MSAAADARITRIKISNPKPPFCVGCWGSPDEDVRFVDFDAAFDGGQLIEEREGVVVRRETADDLHLCENCIKAASTELGFKPDLHTRQVREIRRLERERDHWRDTSKRLSKQLNDSIQNAGD